MGAPLGVALAWRHADLRENLDRQNYHTRCGGLRYDRQCEGKDPRQRRYPTRSTTPDLRRQTVGRRPHIVRLQHPKGVNAPLGVALARLSLESLFTTIISQMYSGIFADFCFGMDDSHSVRID